MRIFTTLAAIAALSAPAHAGHNNPWATPDDTILSKNHDDNQVKSIGTPGEDEMRGALTQAGFGTPGGTRGAESAGNSAGGKGGLGGGFGSGRGGHSGGKGRGN